MPLSDLSVRNAKPGTKAVRLYDAGGLYLEVAPSGSKLWRWKYRFNEKEKRLALGKYPDTSLKDARGKRDAARKLLANDVDPGEHRKAQKAARAACAANSFEVVAQEWYAKYSPNWVENHANRIIRRLERDIFPWIGGRPIDAVKAPELLAVIRRIEHRGGWKLRTELSQTAARCFGTQWPLEGPSATRQAICGALCHRCGASTSPRSQSP